MSKPNTITLATQTMFAELTQRALDAEFDALYDERGLFKRRRIKTREYWYYQRSVEGRKTYSYVGPVGDVEITRRVEQFDTIKSDFNQRREMVRALLAAGLPAPDLMTGAVAEALWKAGFFRLRGVLIGTAAFQCYSGILGVRLPSTSLMTQDLDAAQFYDVSHQVGDSMPPILEVLRAVDATFEAVPDLVDRQRVTRFRAKNGFLVEFLTPNRGSDDHADRPAEMPALGGASAQPLRFLDYLIYEPARSTMLYKGAIPVTVPTPERYAVHKLIVATLRKVDPAKSAKDIDQAGHLLRALLVQRSFTLWEAWEEAMARGEKWQTNLRKGLSMLPDDLRDEVVAAFEKFAATEGPGKPPKAVGGRASREKKGARK